MRNKYPGTCYRCGQTVAPHAGHFELSNGKWVTQHSECAIKYRDTDTGKLGQPKGERPEPTWHDANLENKWKAKQITN